MQALLGQSFESRMFERIPYRHTEDKIAAWVVNYGISNTIVLEIP